MGNSSSRVIGCFVPSGNVKDGNNLEFLEPLDEGLGHSFCYVRPVIFDSPAITPSTSERYTLDSSNLSSDIQSGSFRQEVSAEDVVGQHRPNKNLSETTFKTISGASVSANASTARTGGNLNVLLAGDVQEPAASFESTASFAAIPLQPVPRGSGPLNSFLSGPLERGFASGPLERGFASGPLERGAGCMSGPLDRGMFMSGPLDGTDRCNFSAPLSYGQRKAGIKRLVRSVSRPMRRAFSRTFRTKRLQGSGWMQRVLLHPMVQMVWHPKEENLRQPTSQNCVEVGSFEPEYRCTRNLQWAHGKAGEDRVHVVLSEEQGWLFIGIYDGFSGPDAPDFLMSNLYKAIDKELEGLLWDYEDGSQRGSPTTVISASNVTGSSECLQPEFMLPTVHNGCTETLLSGSQSCNDLSENQLSAEVPPPVQSERKEIVGNCPVGDELENESVQDDYTVDARVRARESDIQQLGVVNQDHCAYLDEKNADVATDDNLKDASCCPKENSWMTHRKSKRLYELLQMELEQYSKTNESCLGRDTITEKSGDPLRNFQGELCATEDLAEANNLLCATSIKGESSGHVDVIVCVRESEDTLEGASVGSEKIVKSSVSSSTQKHMMKKSLIGFKLGKMYRKQKSLRKKLFPWSYDWHRDQQHLDEKVDNPSLVIRRCKSEPVDHCAVLKAMSKALQTTEDAYIDMVENALDINPELALMGSCVLVMLMKDQDVYVMNLGDSRVVLAQDRLNDCFGNSDLGTDGLRCRNRPGGSLVHMELDRISEESPMRNQNNHIRRANKSLEISLCGQKMHAIQLSTDHSTSIYEEVWRIKSEHSDDPQAILNDRVKGQLKVTRAFGAGFLKKPKFNDGLLEMFRIDYIGTSPYVSCTPSVAYHRLCSNDRFLVLSSDGLYQYFSNEEVVSHVAWFLENMPEGDPAQYLIAELLLRAAKKNGMDFHELLDIPQGDRRKYHDDVSVMVVSLEGRIWRSSG